MVEEGRFLLIKQEFMSTLSREHPGFIRRYIFSTDHKVIGIQYYLVSMIMALVGGMLAMLMRVQLAWPGVPHPWLGKLLPSLMPEGVMLPEGYLAIITMHGTIMVFFVVSLTLVSGFGNYLIPIQIGARDMAYPVLNMLSFWVIVPACLLMLGSFLVEGGAAASGWTAYPPLSALRQAVPGSGLGQTLWLLSMALFIVSFTMGGLNYVTTILNLRTRGMTMSRLPMTIWTMFTASVIGLLTFPALTAAAILLLFDRHFGTSFYIPTGVVIGGQAMAHQGGTPLLWQHLFWFLGHPEVYVLVLPALGVSFDIMAAFTRKPIFGYKLILYSLLATSIIGVVVWGHHMFVSGMNPYLGEVFSIATLIVTIPMALIGFALVASFWGGNIRLQTPMLFVIGVIILFGTGGFGGIFLGNATSDIMLHSTYFVVGHFHMMIGGVTLFSAFAATYYWFPKMFGRMMNERLGKIHFWLSLVSFYGMFLGMHFIGLDGAPRRYYSFGGFEMLKAIQFKQLGVTLSSFIFGISSFIFLFNFFWSLFRGKKAGPNPWRATTLEWTTSSPPPHGNWQGETPKVHRWAYDYSLPGSQEDFTPQSQE